MKILHAFQIHPIFYCCNETKRKKFHGILLKWFELDNGKFLCLTLLKITN